MLSKRGQSGEGCRGGRTIQAINTIDTALACGQGHAEKVVGRALKEYGRRGDMVIATKVCLDWAGTDVFRSGSKGRTCKEIDGSLTRLDTDCIDIYQVSLAGPARSY